MIVAVASGKRRDRKDLRRLCSSLGVGPPAHFYRCDVEGAIRHLFLRPDLRTPGEVLVPFPTLILPDATPAADAGGMPFRGLGPPGKEGQGHCRIPATAAGYAA